MARVTEGPAREIWRGPGPKSPPYYNYRLEHVGQVERDAIRLLGETEADQEILLAAIWTHDRFQPQYSGDDHAGRAAEWAAANLVPLGFPAGKVEPVCVAVGSHSDPPHTIPEQATEARLLWDADKLSKIGALHVVSYLCAAPGFPEKRIAFTELAALGWNRFEEEEIVVRSFYTARARRMAAARRRRRGTLALHSGRRSAYESGKAPSHAGP